MRVTVVAPPAPVVTWEEADQHLKLAGDTEEQAYVESLIAAATGHIDVPAGWLGRSIGLQTLEARLDAFCEIALPFPPVIDIVSVKYLDTDNVEQTLAPDQYELMGNRLVTAWNVSWPSWLRRAEAVRIRYRAGYQTVPDPIRAAILLMVGDMFEFRETAQTGSAQATAVPMSTTVANLLGPFRVWA
jgi:uncharacterized phiE125 gp8 family phage protein